MATNKYFNHFGHGREQDLIQDLIIENIKIYGHNVKYIPRVYVNKDELFGEDTLSKFINAIDVEMYIKEVDGFGGDGDFLSKFNLEIRDTVTLTIAKKRFEQIRTEKLYDEVGFNYQLESANTNSPGNSHSVMLEDGNGNNYSITSTRPMEGDLIYFPMSDDIFEISFVEHEAIFYTHGSLQTFDLTCEKFSYSSEVFDTGEALIDIIEDTNSLDALFNEIQLETGDTLLHESGGVMLVEFRIESTDKSANNEFFQNQSTSIIDWSENSPFSDTGIY